MPILFDLDGTLLDTSQDIHTAVNLLLEQEKRNPAAYEDVRRWISFGGKKILEQAFNLSSEDSKDQAYLQALFPRIMQLLEQTNFQSTKPFPGIDSLLGELDAAELPWGIVTNRIAALSEPLVKNYGFMQNCACIVSGDTTNHSKPHPEPLNHACKLLNVPAQDCLFIGDARTDVQAGKAAGMSTMAVGFGFVPPDDPIDTWQADYMVQHANEILPWIKQWSKQAV